MQYSTKHIIKNIVILIGITMFFSCETSFNEINDFLADKNLPIAVTKNISMVYTDSGYVTNKLKAPLLYNFENRKNNLTKNFLKEYRLLFLINKETRLLLLQTMPFLMIRLKSLRYEIM